MVWSWVCWWELVLGVLLSYLFELGLGLRHVCVFMRLGVGCACRTVWLRVECRAAVAVVFLTVRLVGYWSSRCDALRCAVKSNGKLTV